MRTNTHELLEFIDVAIVAERLCEQMDLTPEKMLDYLKSRGCRVGGVTMGERGLLWYDETGAVRQLPALPIPRERVLDTNGAGDVFHGAYVYSYLAQSRQKLAGAFRVCARGVDLQDPAPRQRGRICRRLPTSRPSSRSSRSGHSQRESGIEHGPRFRRRQHQHGCGGDRRPASARSARPSAGKAVLYFPGGKGANQAVAAAKLGAPTTLIGRLGKDAFGQ